jgi:hypothetical protein
MVRPVRFLLAVAVGFVVMTAGDCPPEFCAEFPEFPGCVENHTTQDSEATYVDSGEAADDEVLADASEATEGD